MMSGEVNKHWDWGSAAAGYPDTSERLRLAMHKYRHLKVQVQQGYYDFATPHYAAEYTFRHMGIAPEFQDNVEWAYYEAGHMMYIDRTCREKQYADTAGVLQAGAGEVVIIGRPSSRSLAAPGQRWSGAVPFRARSA